MNAGTRLTALSVTFLLAFVTSLTLACDPEAEESSATTTPAALAGTAGPALPPAPSPTLALTVEPTAAAPTAYVVESGDYPSLIADKVGVPAAEQDAWIAAMLALNATEATALQIGQELQLPPFASGAGAGVATAPQSQPSPTDVPASDAVPTATVAVDAPTPTEVPTTVAVETATVAPTTTPVATATAVPTSSPTPATGCESFTTQAARDWCHDPSGDTLNCEHFTSSAEATRFLNEHDPNNINGLDGSPRDGVACESLG
jgi:LysM repeat protein